MEIENNKPFTVALIRDLENKVSKGEISYSRMVEIMNEKAGFTSWPLIAPRRCQIDLNTPAELAIYKAMQEVESLESDVRLTKAVLKLTEARNLVADFVDGIDEAIEG